MLLADLRHDYVRTYYKTMSECDFDAVQEIFAAMMKEGADLLAAEGVAPQRMSFERFLDMRYVGQEFPIQTPIGAADLATARSRIAAPGLRPPARSPLRPPGGARTRRGRQFAPHRDRPARARGVSRNSARRAGRRGRPSSGAISCSSIPSGRSIAPSTIAKSSAPAQTIARPGGDIRICLDDPALRRRHAERRAERGTRSSASARAHDERQTGLDPVTLEVLRNALPAIADEMAVDLQRTSYNMMIYEVQDYCCALLDGRAD